MKPFAEVRQGAMDPAYDMSFIAHSIEAVIFSYQTRTSLKSYRTKWRRSFGRQWIRHSHVSLTCSKKVLCLMFSCQTRTTQPS